MPLLTPWYAGTHDFEVQPVLKALDEALVATGTVAVKGLKGRFVRCDPWRIADGQYGDAFAHPTFVTREGRPHEVCTDIAERANTAELTSLRGIHARRISGDDRVRYAEAFRRVDPAVVEVS